MLLALVILFALLVLLVFLSIIFYVASYKTFLDLVSDSDYNELSRGEKHVS